MFRSPVRPYFLWWTDLSEAGFAERLGDPDPAVRAYWLGALLREAHTTDVWRFTTPSAVRAQWPHLIRHLGRTRAMWAWLLQIDPEDSAWPPSAAIAQSVRKTNGRVSTNVALETVAHVG